MILSQKAAQPEMDASAGLVHKTGGNCFHNFWSERNGSHVNIPSALVISKWKWSASAWSLPLELGGNCKTRLVHLAPFSRCSCFVQRTPYYAYAWDPVSKPKPRGILARIPVSSAQTQTNNGHASIGTTDSEPRPLPPPRPVRIVSTFGEGRTSSLNSASWQDILLQTVSNSIIFFY